MQRICQAIIENIHASISGHVYLDKIERIGYNNHAEAVGSILLLTGCPLIYFKEVSVLREKDSNVRKANAIPDDALEALARCLYPMMVAFFESAEGQREFAEWQSQKDTEVVPGGMAESGGKIRLAG